MCLGWERYINACTKRQVKLLNAFCISEETPFPDFVLQWSRCMVKFRFSFCMRIWPWYRVWARSLLINSFSSLPPLGRHLLKILDSYLWIHFVICEWPCRCYVIFPFLVSFCGDTDSTKDMLMVQTVLCFPVKKQCYGWCEEEATLITCCCSIISSCWIKVKPNSFLLL